MTKNNAEGLMKGLMDEIVVKKYTEIPSDLVEELIRISKENREKARALRAMRKCLMSYFNSTEHV